MLASRNGLEEKHQAEIASLEKQLEQSIKARNQLQEENNTKLAKAQACFEKELAVMRSSQNVSNEEQNDQLQKQLEDLKKCSSAADLEAKQKTEDLSNRLLHAEELNSDLISKCSGLEQQETNYQQQINSLNQQVCLLSSNLL